jgi:hypothetical protein
MATPIGIANNADLGGSVLCVKYVRTGFNNPGVVSGTGTSILGSAPAQVANVGAALTLTADTHLGVNIQLNAATGTCTLPASTGTGNQYVITSTITATSQIVIAAGSDKLFGVCLVAATASGNFVINNNTTITMNGTTTGGIKGSQIILTDVALNTWVVEANLVGSGTATTPIT